MTAVAGSDGAGTGRIECEEYFGVSLDAATGGGGADGVLGLALVGVAFPLGEDVGCDGFFAVEGGADKSRWTSRYSAGLCEASPATVWGATRLFCSCGGGPAAVRASGVEGVSPVANSTELFTEIVLLRFSTAAIAEATETSCSDGLTVDIA